MKGKFAYLVFVLIVFSTIMCKSPRYVISETPEESRSLPESVTALTSGWKREYSTLKLNKIDVDLVINGIANHVKGNLAIYRDSLMVLSVIPALGYEAIRIMCTPDSIIVLNRQEKSYMASSFDAYRAKYKIPLEFNDIQAIFSNEAFYYKINRQDRRFESNVKIGDDENLYLLESFIQQERLTNQGIRINARKLTLDGMFIVDYERRMRMNLLYSDFATAATGLFPRSVEVDLFENSNSIEIDLKYGQVIFNDSLKVRFMAPEHYTRTDI